MEEGLHRLGLTVRTVPIKGRAIFTIKPFHPGEVVIKQEPYVSVPNYSATTTKICDECFTPTPHSKSCSACHVAWYCGTACQKLDWNLHKIECKSLCKLDKEKRKLLTPSLRLMVKLYLRSKLQAEKKISSSSFDNYGLVESLVSHMSHVNEKQLITYAQMANLVNAILQWPDLNLKEVAENFSKFACNAHTICNFEFQPLGTGLYPIVSLINHSCRPNCVLMFEGKTAVARAVDFIPENSEVFITYIETASCVTTRQKALQEQYFFKCACPRCDAPGENDVVEENCELESEVREISEKVCSNSIGNQSAIGMYKEVEKRQMESCHPGSFALLRTREKLVKILMEEKEWSEALRYCRMTIPVYEGVYGGIHPLLGLQHYTCGKLEWLLEETEESVRSLTKAADVLRITNGTKSPCVQELVMKLDEARAEASFRINGDIRR